MVVKTSLLYLKEGLFPFKLTKMVKDLVEKRLRKKCLKIGKKVEKSAKM